MKSFLCCLPFFISSILYSQESILNFQKLDFQRQIRNVENYSLPDDKTNNLAVILAQKDKIAGYLYNTHFEKIGEASGIQLKNKYSETIGHIVSHKTNYTLVYRTISQKKFGYISINFKTGKITTDEIEFAFDREKYVETINFDNRMIMMSVTKGNALILREFTSDLLFKKIATFQLDAEDKSQKLINKIEFFFSKSARVVKIDNRIPNTVSRASTARKMYLQKGKVYLTFEDEESQTVLKIIDLASLSLITKNIFYPKGKISEFKNFNSFIYGENIFQMASSKEEMIFQVKNFENDIIKEYYVAQENEITFKNTPILKYNSLPNKKKKEIPTTNKFLKKIASNIGVSVIEDDNGFLITLGGYKITNYGGTSYSGAEGGPDISSFSSGDGGGHISFPAYNAVLSSFNDNSSSETVYINSFLNKSFNHIKEKEFKGHIFDRIKKYREELKWIVAEDVFIHNGKTYFSFWSTKEQTYSLIQF